MTDAQREEYETALYWLKRSKQVTVIGEPPDKGEPVHVTVIVSGVAK